MEASLQGLTVVKFSVLFLSIKVEENEAEEGNAEDLLSANQNEDRLIASLEKKLGMKKRKNLPSKFKEDGLDCILFQFMEVHSCLKFFTS